MSNASDASERCFGRQAPEEGPPLFQSGNLVFQAHHVGWIVAGIFMMVSTVTSFWLVNKHLQWYTNKREQRYIVRILFLVPIYSIVSLSSYLFWDHATALILLRDGYESTVLTAFFYLLLMYISPNPDEQKAVFIKVGLSRQADREARKRRRKVRRWVFPLGFVKWKPEDGLFFLQLMKWGVLQYCVLRPLTTLIAVGLNYVGLYCEKSLSPAWGHVYIVVIVSVSVTIAMYCLIQLYVPIAKQLAPQKPLLKLFAIKAVVFLTFWQATGLSVLSLAGVVKDTRYMTAEDINVGIQALLETFEMMLFAFLHVRAFSYKPYRPHHTPGSSDPPPTRTNRLKSLGHAFDFRETFREIWVGCVYIADRLKGREPRPDKGARRVAHLEAAFGQLRPGFEGSTRFGVGDRKGKEKERDGEYADRDGEPGKVEIQVEVAVENDLDVEQRLWLEDHRREKSEGLGLQIERELQKRGYRLGIRDPEAEADDDIEAGEGHEHKPQTSWWRSVYERISQSAPDPEAENITAGSSRRQSRSGHHPSRHSSSSRRRSRDLDHTNLLQERDDDYEDPPPASAIRKYRKNRQRRESRSGGVRGHRRSDTDILTPLAIFEQRHLLPQSHRQLQQRELPLLPNSGQGSTLTVPQAYVSRNDSLLARVFPRGTSVSSTDHGNESAVSSSPSQSTPRARLTPASPVVLTQVPGYRVGPGVGRYKNSPDARPLPPLPDVVVYGVGSEELPPLPTSRGLSSNNDGVLGSASPEAIFIAPDPSTVAMPSFHRRESAHAVAPLIHEAEDTLALHRSEEHGRDHPLPQASKSVPQDAKPDPLPPQPSHRRENAHAHGKTFLVPRKPPPPLSEVPNRGTGDSMAVNMSSVRSPISMFLTEDNSGESPANLPPPISQPTLRRSFPPISPSNTQPSRHLQQCSPTAPIPRSEPNRSRAPREHFTLRPARPSRSSRRISTHLDSQAVNIPTAVHRHTSHQTRRSVDNTSRNGDVSPLQLQPQLDSFGRYPQLSPQGSHHVPKHHSNVSCSPVSVVSTPLDRHTSTSISAPPTFECPPISSSFPVKDHLGARGPCS